jgi:hypothetical protein
MFMVFLFFFYFAEVEKQLQGNESAVPLGTPHMSYKKSHSGSTGNIHGLVGLSDQMAAGETASLCFSTFVGCIFAHLSTNLINYVCK